VRVSVVQPSPSVQVAAQLPSQVSPISTTPFPQLAEQSLSFPELHPGAQQPSPFVHIVIAGCVHRTSQVPGVPVRTSLVQTMPSSAHVVGQLPSQVSVPSTTPLPHIAMQFGSLLALQPGAQQLSPPMHIVIGGCVHWTLHCVGVLVSTSLVHAIPSSGHVVGQFPSQVSPISTMSLPQLAEQSSSFVEVQPGAQQPSPSLHVVIGGCVHIAVMCPPAPWALTPFRLAGTGSQLERLFAESSSLTEASSPGSQ
jgi:hypothetical protein